MTSTVVPAWCTWDPDKPESCCEYFFSSRAGLMMKHFSGREKAELTDLLPGERR